MSSGEASVGKVEEQRANCLMGGPNNAQFGNRVHAGITYVWTEADHANGTNDLHMGYGGLER